MSKTYKEHNKVFYLGNFRFKLSIFITEKHTWYKMLSPKLLDLWLSLEKNRNLDNRGISIRIGILFYVLYMEVIHK